jgi:hypothetical protein
MICDGNDCGRMANNTVQGLVSKAIRKMPNVGGSYEKIGNKTAESVLNYTCWGL